MLDTQEIEQILNLATLAPSGDNSQPWQFKISEDSLFIFNIPNRDSSIFNLDEKGSYLAHGALIENINVLSAARGYTISVESFPGITNCVAKIHFLPDSPRDQILAASIEKRTTNRKPYAEKQLDPSDKEALEKSISTFAAVQLYSVGYDKRLELAALLSVNDKLFFENKTMHTFLFNLIKWTRAEEATPPGLYVKTMEFPLPLQFLIRHVLKNLSLVLALNSIGFSNFVANQSAATYCKSSAYYAFTINDDADESYVTVGRAIQRFWLTAAQRSLSVQPVTGLPYLAKRIRANRGEMFAANEQTAILESVEGIRQLFQVPANKQIAMILRVGYAPHPSARSNKLPPVIMST